MDEDYETLQSSSDGTLILLKDKASERTLAFISLLDAARNVREPELLAEAIKMMERLRLSIPVNNETSLGVIKGGRGN